MTVSRVTSASRASPPRRWLICLDLQRDHVVPGRPSYVARNATTAAACARVLGLARSARWKVVHSQLFRRDGEAWPPRDLFSAPIEGLRPRVTEPVFLRRGLSAFADPEFAAELRGARGAQVFLIGFSLADTCLATALAAHDAGLSLTLLEDAVGVGTPATAAAARTVLTRFVRLASSRRLGSIDMELTP